jgi:hypothetical protein
MSDKASNATSPARPRASRVWLSGLAGVIVVLLLLALLLLRTL